MVQYSDSVPDIYSLSFANGCYVTVYIEGKKCIALLDTGASVSVVSDDLISNINTLSNRVNIGRLSSVTGLGGNRVDILGEIELRLRLGNSMSFNPHIFHVMKGKLSVPIILGLDFLKKNNLIIDVPNSKLILTGTNYDAVEFPLGVEMLGDTLDVYALENITLLAGERKLIPLTVKSKLSDEGCFVPIEFCSKSYKMASSLNCLDGGVTWGEVSNVSNGNVTISKSTKLGYWQPTCLVVNVIESSEVNSELVEMLRINESQLGERERESLVRVVNKYRNVFSVNDDDLGFCRTVTHSIDVGDCKPIKQRYRRLHPPIKDKVEEELAKMERQGVIEKSVSPWCSPLVPVRKKDGSVRICIDYRKLNSVTKVNCYPLPHIEDNLSQFEGAKFFSTLDLLSGYHQVALDNESKEKTAFSTERGLYQFRVMPQGACGSPATFQNLMNVVLGGIPTRHALAYLDDILVMGTSFDDHLRNLEEVFSRLLDHGLKLSVKKCQLFRESVNYLGHVLTRDGVKPSDHNVKALMSLPIPKTVRDVKRINGLVNYYSRFIPNIASIMAPLYRITSEKKLKWTEDCNNALNEIKRILCSYPILSYPRFGPNDRFILTTDGSGTGIGATLSQIQDGEERTLGYGSVSFNSSQTKYSATDKELAALRWGVKHFKPFLFGRKFTIRVDHQSILYLDQMKCIDNRLMRTYDDLQIGDFDIEYLRGSDNVVADTLSRAPLSDVARTEEDDQLFKQGSSEVVHEVAGGPNSLFECLEYSMNCEETNTCNIREEVVNHILSNLSQYGYNNNSKDRKLITSMKQNTVLADHRMIKPFADRFSCNVYVKHDPGPLVRYISKSPRYFVVLQCLGGIHYNVVRKKENIADDVSDRLEQLLVINDENSEIDDECHSLEDGILTELDRTVLKENSDSNYQQRENKESPGKNSELPFLDWGEACEWAESIHLDLGHAGRRVTLNVCKTKFRAKKLRKIVEHCLKNCDTCQRFKAPVQSQHQRAPMFPRTASKPGETIAVDLMDLGSRTRRGNKVMLVGIDTYTRFAYAVPLRNKTSKTVADAFERSVLASSVYVPSSVLSDNGPEFRGRWFKDMLGKYGIKHDNSIPYHPSSNGVVERLNKTLKSKLATSLNGSYDDWDIAIYKIIVQYNRTIHSETGRTPISFYANNDEGPVLTRNKFTKEKGKNFIPFNVKDLVLRKIPFKDSNNKHKLAPRYDGPYEIIECLSSVTYRIRELNTNNRRKTHIVHVSQIRKYHCNAQRRQIYTRRSSEGLDRLTLSSTNHIPELKIEKAVDDPPPIVVFSPAYVDAEVLRQLRESTMESGLGVNNETPERELVGGHRRSVSTPGREELPPLYFDSAELGSSKSAEAEEAIIDEQHNNKRKSISEVNNMNYEDGWNCALQLSSECTSTGKSISAIAPLISENVNDSASEDKDNIVASRITNSKETTGNVDLYRESLVSEISGIIKKCRRLTSAREYKGPLTRSRTLQQREELNRRSDVIGELRQEVGRCIRNVDSILDSSGSEECPELRVEMRLCSIELSVSLIMLDDSEETLISEFQNSLEKIVHMACHLETMSMDLVGLNHQDEGSENEYNSVDEVMGKFYDSLTFVERENELFYVNKNNEQVGPKFCFLNNDDDFKKIEDFIRGDEGNYDEFENIDNYIDDEF